MKRFIVSLGLAAVLGCANSWAAAARSDVDRFEPVRQYIREQLVETGTPSVAIAVAERGRIVWQEGFGWADRERRKPATEHTVYSLASVSKPITATALMTLVEAGKVELDRSINDYLGSAKLNAKVGSADGATVRRVATHTAGLPMFYRFFDPAQRPSMDEVIQRYGNIVTEPGDHVLYSNLGYGLLDQVVARASGRGFEEYVRSAVFVPLGMTHSSVNVGPGLAEYLAVRYDESGAPIPYYEPDTIGAGGIWSSAHDLIRFALFHLGHPLPDQKRILSAATLDSMHRTEVLQDSPFMHMPPKVGMAICWMTDERAGYRLVYHGGRMAGVGTYLMFVPEQDVALVLLGNSNGFGAAGATIIDKTLQAVLPRWQPYKRQPDSTAQPPQLPSELLGKWQGMLQTHEGSLPMTLEFLGGTDVHARLGEQLITLVNDISYEGGAVKGKMLGDVRTEDANKRGPYQIRLSLTHRGAMLNGVATATNPNDTNGVPYWVELKKQ